ncbi:MAG: hypothetical protein K8J08_11660 [Thermoanaerobaculia bacterium]|nr:hypothetical protein [Thermoanaerobaculia bacterium]
MRAKGKTPSNEYDPVREGPSGLDLQIVQDHFAAAAEPYLAFPWSWLAWSVLLPMGALLTRPVERWRGHFGVLALWFCVVLLGGLVEGLGISRGRRRFGGSALGSWVMRAQGNLSLVAVMVSAAIVFQGFPMLLPGVWLLLLGHSFFALGGLAFPPFRAYAIGYQVAGALALWPMLVDPLWVFAAATFIGNLGIAIVLFRDG